MEGLVYLFNHELMHNWTGKVIQNENEEEQYWFSEGFTEYYSFKNIARNKIYDLDGSYFLREVNSGIRALYTSPVLASSNNEITYENYWSNRDFGKLPYYRGALFAFYLDHKIQQNTQGIQDLDDVMLTIKQAAVSEGQKLTHEFFIQTANSYLKEDIRPFFEKHILQGEPMDLNEVFAGLQLDFEPTATVFDLGFQVSEEQTISDMDTSSNAYAAGLRNGDRVTFRSYNFDASYPAEFTILKNKKEEKITFYPSRKAEIPQLTSAAQFN